jgi:hypothetical protein
VDIRVDSATPRSTNAQRVSGSLCPSTLGSLRWIKERGTKREVHSETHLLTSRLLVYASDEDQQGRYYKKTLEEVDEISLVRDRGGPGGLHGDQVDEEEEADEGGYDDDQAEEEDDQEDEPVRGDSKVKGDANRHEKNTQADSSKTEKSRTEHQHLLRLESEWGMYRSPPDVASSSVSDSRASSVGRRLGLEENEKEEYTVS